MKKIVCELCEGTEFTKDNGMFVCNNCGTRYTAEEARAMMRDVDGAVPAVNSVPAASVPAGNPNQAQIDNLLVLATSSYEASKNDETINFCNKVIELDATCFKAWLLKGKAIGWESTLKEPRVSEAAHSFCKAIDFAPEEDKEETKRESLDVLERMGMGLVGLRKNMFEKYPDEEELNGFDKDRKVIAEAFSVMLQHGYGTGIPDAFAIHMSDQMNLAAVKVYKGKPMTYEVIKETIKVEKQLAAMKNQTYRPKDNSKFWNETYRCFDLLQKAIEYRGETVDDDLITLYKNMIVVGEFITDYNNRDDFNKSAYRYRGLLKKAKDALAEVEPKLEAKKEEEKKRAEAEKKERIQAYWEAHAEEKTKLDQEKNELETEKTALSEKENAVEGQIASVQSEADKQKEEVSAQISGIQQAIFKEKERAKGKVASEVEIDTINTQIKSLENKRASLGLFAGKEKKQLTEQIAVLHGRIESVKGRIAGERGALMAEVNANTAKLQSDKAALEAKQEELGKKLESNLAPLNEQKNEMSARMAAIEKRLSAIEEELTKDPEDR